ncbi:Adenylyl cyclase-associated protein [Operophtera brumata]|uniref:Adenylyl cyclase-associated protein n=1 Tax=Operophtera brumata TaxID=104452 RepID=A0A0L7KQU1_OPEBR|nr:Adenylyl cyclase-associated protein [Operophtera brumata]
MDSMSEPDVKHKFAESNKSETDNADDQAHEARILDVKTDANKVAKPIVDELSEQQITEEISDQQITDENSDTQMIEENSESPPNSNQNRHSVHNSPSDNEEEDDLVFTKREITKKRYSIDYKSRRLDFKRFSVDCRRDSVTLEELARLEQELAKTAFAVRPVTRRKSTGILKSTTSSSNSVVEQRVTPKQPSESEEDDEVFEAAAKENETEGPQDPQDPPATPVGRDELAMRRHRFFSDLVCAARAAIEHRVRFDPLGPVVADAGELWQVAFHRFKPDDNI